jgi:hypothetical protein
MCPIYWKHFKMGKEKIPGGATRSGAKEMDLQSIATEGIRPWDI